MSFQVMVRHMTGLKTSWATQGHYSQLFFFSPFFPKHSNPLKFCILVDTECFHLLILLRILKEKKPKISKSLIGLMNYTSCTQTVSSDQWSQVDILLFMGSKPKDSRSCCRIHMLAVNNLFVQLVILASVVIWLGLDSDTIVMFVIKN